jgi:hypothetical protein
MPLPPPISAYEEGSFASFTVRERLPKILADVTEQFDLRDRRDPRNYSLVQRIDQGASSSEVYCGSRAVRRRHGHGLRAALRSPDTCRLPDRRWQSRTRQTREDQDE